MPTLPKTFTAQLGGIGGASGTQGIRSPTAQDFGGGIGAALQEFGATGNKIAASLHADQEADEARQSLVEHAKIRAEYARRLDEARMNGEDIGVIKEQMAARMGAVSENFQTKNGRMTAELHDANAIAQFDSHANNIAVTRASDKAKRQGQEWLQTNSDMLRRDPSQLELAEREADEFAAGLKLPPEKKKLVALSLRQNLNLVAAQANADLNPELTLEALRKGGVYELTESQTQQVEGAARQAQARIRAQDALERATEKDRLNVLQDQAFNEHVQAIYSPGGADLKKVLADSRLNRAPEKKEQLMGIARAHAKQLTEPRGTNPGAYNTIRERIDLPYGDQRKLTDPGELWKFYGKGLTLADTKALEARMQKDRTPDGRTFQQAESGFLANMKGQLDKSTMMTLDTAGGARVQAFTVFVQQRVEDFKEKKQDPYQLFDPTSPHYLGKYVPQFLTGSQRRASETVEKMEGAMGGGAKRDPLRASGKVGGAPVKRKSLDDIFGGK